MRIVRRAARVLMLAVVPAGGWLAFGLRAAADVPNVAKPAAILPRKILFNRDIRPILSENCFHCHGPDSAHRKAGLRLDREEGLFGKSDNGRPVVRGDLKQSMIFERISSADADEVMPPPSTHKTLNAEERDTVKRWIEQGAAWEPHWSLVPPTRPAAPAVKEQAWVRNPIDAFVLSRLEAEGLSPAEEADRRTLIRRLSLDLTGLPPTPDEVEAFVADKSPDAYEKVVDRLLASPRYGEHRGRYWLDAARYADTHGIHNDNYREMWPYRDWVIDAFNTNQPFDRFVVEQIAGDLLPNRTMEQQIATGFHRCNATTSEGGSIDEEVQAMYMKDRVETTGTVFLGLTVGCASCHDHKFDPVAQKEFYQLTAFFRNTIQPAMDGNVSNTPPIIIVPRAEDRERWESLQKQNAELTALRTQRKAESGKAFEIWVKGDEPAKLRQPLDPDDEQFVLPLDEGDGTGVSVWRKGEQGPVILPGGMHWGDGPNKDKAIHFDAKSSLEVANAADLEADQPFTISAWVFVPAEAGNHVIAAKLDPTSKTPASGWMLEVDNGIPVFQLFGKDAKEKLQIRGGKGAKLPAGKWSHLLVTYDGNRKSAGLAIHLNGKAQGIEKADEARLASSIHNDAPLSLGSDGKRDFKGGAIQDLRIYRRAVTSEEIEILAKWNVTKKALAKGGAKLTPAEKQELQLLYLNRFDPQYRQTTVELAGAEAGQQEIKGRSPVTHVMQEKAGSKPMAFVLFRGQYDQKRDQVEPATPAALNAYPADWPKDRLGLAWWLVDAKNPLTARVTVNRFWQEVFGQGLVRTTEDFGIMGENPVNPKLLDWLAVEFRESGWDVKKFFKLMVTSSAYRQAAITTPDKLAKDPGNRLLSRGPRFRMDAEVLRDVALATSGLLGDKIGGPSVKPYQPPGVWEAVAMFGSDTRFYKPDTGEGLYRRSLYTFWKRSAPPAAMDIFNAPSRLACTVRRERTNTPLQALATLNDPQWIEAARRLAERTMKEPTADDFDKRLDFITARVLSRPYDSKERAICRAVFDELQSSYKTQPEAAKKLIADGETKPDTKLPEPELAAWTMLASQVMNTDEALNK